MATADRNADLHRDQCRRDQQPPATVSITVQQPAPVAQPDTASVPFNTATTINVTSNDTGSPFSSVQVTQNPTHGTVQVSGLNIIYTPTSGYTGSDTFNYTVTNSTSTSSPAAVTLNVAQPQPVAQPQLCAGAVQHSDDDQRDEQ